MTGPGNLWKGAALALLLATAACGGAAGAAPAGSPTPANPAAAELEAIARARADSARMRFTEADVRFMTMMIGHHSQAVLMARLVPERTQSSAMRTLAGRIISAQDDEIATMRRWLQDRRQPVPEIHIMGLEMHGAEHAAHMPGMISTEQLRRLEAARGAEFDRLFLEYMIQHHRGAVTMVEELFATNGAGQDEEVFKFASDVQVDQRTEIDRMEQMLAALPPAGRER